MDGVSLVIYGGVAAFVGVVLALLLYPWLRARLTFTREERRGFHITPTERRDREP